MVMSKLVVMKLAKYTHDNVIKLGIKYFISKFFVNFKQAFYLLNEALIRGI